MKNGKSGLRRLVLAAAAVAGFYALAQPAQAEGPNDLTIVLPKEPRDLDPCNVVGSVMGFILHENVVETLTQLSLKDGSVQPRLATSWEQVDDQTWRFHLRQGVKFHDGEDFNAATAAKAIERQAVPELVCASRVKLPTAVLTPKVIDDYTLEITTSPAQPLLPVFLSFVGMSVPGLEPKISRDPVGTGPFVFQKWDAGQSITLKRFDGYWGDKPAIENVTYLWRDQSSLRAAMVDAGEADIAYDLAPQDATDPTRDFTYSNGETTRIRMIMQPPLDDIRVRKALNLAFDREALRGTVLNEDVVPAAQFMPPNVNGFNPKLKPWPYDPDQAKKLLAEAKADGVPVDAPIRLVGRTGFYVNGEEALQAMAQMWNAVGFNIKLEMMEGDNWHKLVNKPYDADRPAMLVQEMHDNNNGDAAFTLYFRFDSNGGQSETNIPALDKVIEAADAASGPKRTELYQEANRMIAEDIVPGIFMYHMVGIMRIAPRVDYRPTVVHNGLFELAPIKFKS